jgi:xanthine dehydrogenase YagS FAD-binding subunit
VDEAERLLVGHRANDAAFTAAAESALAGAQGRGHNDFKIALAKRSLCAVLNQATRAGVQS